MKSMTFFWRSVLLYIVCIVLLSITFVSDTDAETGYKWHPGHYVGFGAGADWDNFSIPEDARDPVFQGIKIIIKWGDIESQKGVYDFSSIENALQEAESHQKGIILEIRDRVFGASSCPDKTGGTTPAGPAYLASPEYDGGFLSDDLESDKGNCIVRLWNEKVIDREIALFQALAARFDHEPYFYGIRTEETPLGIRPESIKINAGWTPEKRYQQMIRLNQAIAEAFQNTPFMAGCSINCAGYTREVYAHAVQHGYGVSWPDTHYGAVNGEWESPHLAGGEFRGRLAVHAETQNAGGTPYITPEELYDLAVNRFGATHMVWKIRDRKYDPDNPRRVLEEQTIPFLRQGNPTLTACPENLNGCDGQDNSGASQPDAPACHQLTGKSGSNIVPVGYATPWNLFSGSQDTFLKAYCDTQAKAVTLVVGDNGADEYVYKRGYSLQSGKWEPYTLQCTGSGAVGDWCKGQARADVPANIPTTTYILAYHCRLVDGQWKCGCQDRACTKPAWNLQVAK